MSKTTPRVFISYAHENDAHVKAVADLAEWLRQQGVFVITDKPYDDAAKAPEKGWIGWMQEEIEEADMVLLVCSPLYKKRFEKKEQPGAGAGATFESVIITDELYRANMHNRRMIPVLPDGGDKNNVPVIMREHFMNLRFPSQYDRILTAIREEVTIPQPEKEFEQLPPGQLRNSLDNRLQPREGKLYGREEEVKKVLSFLQSKQTGAEVTALLTGTGGIGKTEVCKAALKAYLATDPPERCFFIKLPDLASAAVFTVEMAKAIGLNEPDSFEQLLPHLPQGLYYLDNMEGMARHEETKQCLRLLRDKPGIRILASSRVESGVFRNSIALDKLPLPEAIQLFIDRWGGKEPLQQSVALEAFVKNDLGCHPLSIVLMSRLGNTYSFERLVDKWQQTGVLMARNLHGEGVERIDNLYQSLLLSSEILKNHKDCLLVWSLAALFPEGIGENVLNYFESEEYFNDEALQHLIAHHILERNEERLTILPPLARFALDEAVAESRGFSWRKVRAIIYPFFITLAWEASSIASTTRALNIRKWVLNLFDTLYMFMIKETSHVQPDRQTLEQLAYSLVNLYQFKTSLSLELLNSVLPLIERNGIKSVIITVLGNLERQLGHIEMARNHYESSIALCQHGQDNVGMANTLKSLADLEKRSGYIDKARAGYEKAIELFKQNEDNLGLANTLRSLGDVEAWVGNVDKALSDYELAIALYKKEENNLGLANTLRSLGDIENELDDLNKARDYYKSAIELFKQEQDNLGLANVLQSLGHMEKKGGYYETALNIYNEAASLYFLEQGNVGMACVCAEMAICFHHLNRLEEKQKIAHAAIRAGITSQALPVMQYVSHCLLQTEGSPEAAQKLVDEYLVNNSEVENGEETP